MNPTVIKVLKNIGKFAVSVGIPAAMSYYENKQLEDKITKIARKVITESNKKG